MSKNYQSKNDLLSYIEILNRRLKTTELIIKILCFAVALLCIVLILTFIFWFSEVNIYIYGNAKLFWRKINATKN